MISLKDLRQLSTDNYGETAYVDVEYHETDGHSLTAGPDSPTGEGITVVDPNQQVARIMLRAALEVRLKVTELRSERARKQKGQRK